MNREQRFFEYIRPLLVRIGTICERHGIPFYASFAIATTDQGTKFQTFTVGGIPSDPEFKQAMDRTNAALLNSLRRWQDAQQSAPAGEPSSTEE